MVSIVFRNMDREHGKKRTSGTSLWGAVENIELPFQQWSADGNRGREEEVREIYRRGSPQCPPTRPTTNSMESRWWGKSSNSPCGVTLSCGNTLDGQALQKLTCPHDYRGRITLGAGSPEFHRAVQFALVRALPNRGKWIYEAKLDGYRCLAANRSGGVVLWSTRETGSPCDFRKSDVRVKSSRQTRLSMVR